MFTDDLLSSAYADLLDGQYDCVDRIILNAYFPLACSPGGFRTWWRASREAMTTWTTAISCAWPAGSVDAYAAGPRKASR